MEEEAFAATSGGLKLKRAVVQDKDKKKKKKKKDHKKKKLKSEAAVVQPELVPLEAPVMTASERAFLEKRKRQEEARLEKMASKTHRQKIAEFNASLAKLTEHNDIPRIGPG